MRTRVKKHILALRVLVIGPFLIIGWIFQQVFNAQDWALGKLAEFVNWLADVLPDPAEFVETKSDRKDDAEDMWGV